MPKGKTKKDKTNAGKGWGRKLLRRLVSKMHNEDDGLYLSPKFPKQLASHIASDLDRSAQSIESMIYKILVNYDEDDARTPVMSRIARAEGVVPLNPRMRWTIRESWDKRVERVHETNDVWDTDAFIRDMIHLTGASRVAVTAYVNGRINAKRFTAPY